MARKKIPDERLVELEDRLGLLSARSTERKRFIQEFAHLYERAYLSFFSTFFVLS
jgi:hypothetical protein